MNSSRTLHPAQVSRGPKQKTHQSAGRSSWARRAAREPILHFTLLGCLAWLGIEFAHSDHVRYVIYAGPAERQRLAANYERQFGARPTEQQTNVLLDRYVRDEIYVREALLLNLDKEDEVIRRRLLQKYEFLRSDLAVLNAPSAATLEQWYALNEQKYATPERVAFSHIYFSVDSRGEEGAKLRASDLLSELTLGKLSRAPERGDPFPGPMDASGLSLEEANRLFGQSALTEAIFRVPPHQWAGPFRSGYGWHLVYVTTRVPSEVPPLSQVRDEIQADYMNAERDLMNERNFAKLRAKYEVRYEDAQQ